MKKYMAVVCTIMICLLALGSCMKKPLPDLPDDAAAFDMGTFHDRDHDNALFGSIEYNGRVYISYGTINGKYRQSCIDSCIGYIIQNEHSSSAIDPDNRDRRIYTIAGDPEHNFLMEFDASVKLMNQPDFLRAVDTNGKMIEIPEFIDALGYEFWEE